MVALVCIALFMSLVLGFLGGRNSMLKDVIKRDEEIESLNGLIEKMEHERDELLKRISQMDKDMIDDGK